MATVMILLRIAIINRYCYNNEINKTTTTDCFDINDNASKFCSGNFFNVYVIKPYIVCYQPIKAI